MRVVITPRNGLGDKLLDVLGFLVWCMGASVTPVVDWCSRSDPQPWGDAFYDRGCFQFPFEVSRGPAEAVAVGTDPSASYCPAQVHRYLQGRKTFEELVGTYFEVARSSWTIAPWIRNLAPPTMIDDECIGVHLRRRDKIKALDKVDHRHETTPEELSVIMDKLREYVKGKVVVEGERKFFVCSDDDAARLELADYLTALHPDVRVVSNPPAVADSGVAAVLDWHCLTRCKCVVQGTRYSTFSMTCAIFSRRPLVNFGDHSEFALLHLWRPLVLLEAHGSVSQTPVPSSLHIRDAVVKSTIRPLSTIRLRSR